MFFVIFSVLSMGFTANYLGAGSPPALVMMSRVLPSISPRKTQARPRTSNSPNAPPKSPSQTPSPISKPIFPSTRATANKTHSPNVLQNSSLPTLTSPTPTSSSPRAPASNTPSPTPPPSTPSQTHTLSLSRLLSLSPLRTASTTPS